MKKIFSISLVLILSVSMFLGCFKNIDYIDKTERPTIDTPSNQEYIKYPTLPTVKPTIDETKIPTIARYSASPNESYAIAEENEVVKFNYTDISPWSYVYAEVDNYRSEYGNFKISITSNGADRIAIQAVYYEMNELSYKPVTIYNGDLASGEQYIVCELGDYKPLDLSYNPVSEKSLKGMTILGFLIFIDSNPTQSAPGDYDGSASITRFKFLADGDKELEDKYVKPSVTNITLDDGYTSVVNEDGNTVVSYNAGKPQYARTFLHLANYSSSYSEFNIKLKTTGVKSLTIALMFNTEGHAWQDEASVLTKTNLTDGEQSFDIDFSSVAPVDSVSFNEVPGYFIKNYKITAIRIYADSDQETVAWGGSFELKGVEFKRTVVEGTTIGKTWSTNVSNIVLGDDILVGGVGSLEFSYYTSWHYLLMPIQGYEPSKKLTIKFIDKDAIDHIGVAIMSNGSEVVVHASTGVMKGATSEIPDKEGMAKGVTETIVYDATTKMYTLTFDFTNAEKSVVTGKSFAENTITAMRFYLNEPLSTDHPVGDKEFTGVKRMQFVSVVFE